MRIDRAREQGTCGGKRSYRGAFFVIKQPMYHCMRVNGRSEGSHLRCTAGVKRGPDGSEAPC